MKNEVVSRSPIFHRSSGHSSGASLLCLCSAGALNALWLWWATDCQKSYITSFISIHCFCFAPAVPFVSVNLRVWILGIQTQKLYAMTVRWALGEATEAMAALQEMKGMAEMAGIPSMDANFSNDCLTLVTMRSSCLKSEAKPSSLPSNHVIARNTAINLRGVEGSHSWGGSGGRDRWRVEKSGDCNRGKCLKKV